MTTQRRVRCGRRERERDVEQWPDGGAAGRGDKGRSCCGRRRPLCNVKHLSLTCRLRIAPSSSVLAYAPSSALALCKYRTRQLAQHQTTHNGDSHARHRYYQVPQGPSLVSSAYVSLRPHASSLGWLQETRFSALRGPTEFFDFNRISRPGDLNQATHVRTCLNPTNVAT